MILAVESLRTVTYPTARSSSPTSPRRPWRPEGDAQPVTTDDDIERTLIELIGEVSVEAKRSFQLAREAAVPGGLVEMRRPLSHRLARATSESSR